MRAPASRTRESLEFNMTPMIDVTFQLIIFFLVAGHLSQQEVQLELDLPGAGTGHRPDEAPARLVVVNVLPTGEIVLGGDKVDAVEFGQRVQIELKKGGGELEVRIRSDRSVPYKMVEPLLVECARRGIWNVAFAVVDPEGN